MENDKNSVIKKTRDMSKHNSQKFEFIQVINFVSRCGNAQYKSLVILVCIYTLYISNRYEIR